MQCMTYTRIESGHLKDVSSFQIDLKIQLKFQQSLYKTWKWNIKINVEEQTSKNNQTAYLEKEK